MGGDSQADGFSNTGLIRPLQINEVPAGGLPALSPVGWQGVFVQP